jgi:hypothetical protein
MTSTTEEMILKMLGTLTEKFEGFEKKMDTMSADIDTMKSDIDTMKADIVTMKADSETKYQTLMEQVVFIFEKVTKNEQDIQEMKNNQLMHKIEMEHDILRKCHFDYLNRKKEKVESDLLFKPYKNIAG